MRQASLLFAAVIFLAAGNLSPAFAGKCYGLDPCYACRNCSACMHCSKGGGTCGVCGGGKKFSNPRPTSSYHSSFESSSPYANFSSVRKTFPKSTDGDGPNPLRIPAVAPQFDRRKMGGHDNSHSPQENSVPKDLSANSLDLDQFPFDPYTGLPNPNYRGKRSRVNRTSELKPNGSEEEDYLPRSDVRSGQALPSDGVIAPPEQNYPYDQRQPLSMPIVNPVYPTSPSYPGSYPYSGSSTGTQHVSGYYRKDGTYVHSYTRRSRSR